MNLGCGETSLVWSRTWNIFLNTRLFVILLRTDVYNVVYYFMEQRVFVRDARATWEMHQVLVSIDARYEVFANSIF